MLFVLIAVISWLVGLVMIDWRQRHVGYATALAAGLGASALDLAGVGRGIFWSYSTAPFPSLTGNLLLNVSLYPVGAWIFIQR